MHTSLPVSIMVWTINDAVIEDHGLLEKQFEDLRSAGFDGVAVYVRCSRYTWIDQPAVATLSRISTWCRKAGWHFWIGPDPRFISRQLIKDSGGAELLLFGDASRASVFPQTTPVVNGTFSIRCTLNPRHGHMFNEVALEYTPVQVFRCYAIRVGAGPLGAGDIEDITARTRFFYNARDRYVEAFGRYTPRDSSAWQVCAFFHVISSHVDYSNRGEMLEYEERLGELKKAGIRTQSVMWDEPGYTCTYGTLPFTPAIRSAVRRIAGREFEGGLWKMAFEAADGSHVPIRTHFYRAIQKSVNDAQRKTNRVMRKLWGPEAVASVHDTWHFESADMCDMNHGSMDLWKGSEVKSGGFIDLGGIQVLRDRESAYYANLAGMSVIAASLGRHSKGGFAFNNLWTVGDDEGAGWQRESMNHCVNVMALFGTRWLAHAYGPVGTIGEENSFLGSPPLPGYPHHSTWGSFPEWNERLRRHFSAIRGNLPFVNVLMVFPVETMYALADPRADELARRIFHLILMLTDAHYQVDVVSTEQAAKGKWSGQAFLLDQIRYEAVVVPHSRIVESHLAAILKKNIGRTLIVGTAPEKTVDNRKLSGTPGTLVADDKGVVQALDSLGVTRPVQGPAGSWVTFMEVPGGIVANVIPARSGVAIGGYIQCQSMSILFPETTGLTRVMFPHEGIPHIMQ